MLTSGELLLGNDVLILIFKAIKKKFHKGFIHPSSNVVCRILHDIECTATNLSSFVEVFQQCLGKIKKVSCPIIET